MVGEGDEVPEEGRETVKDGNGESRLGTARLVRLVNQTLEKTEREIAAVTARLRRESSPEHALLVARNREGLPRHALVIAALERAEAARLLDPRLCLEWAKLAVEKVETVPSPGLQAQAWAEKGNAERMLELFGRARASFDRAHEILEADDGGLVSVRADVLSLQSSLEHALRRPEVALRYLDQALSAYRALKMEPSIWRAKIKKANVLFSQGELLVALGEAQDAMRRIVTSTDGVDEPCLRSACHVALLTLVELALTAEDTWAKWSLLDQASRELENLAKDYMGGSTPLWRIRYRWVTGRLEAARGRDHAAKRILDQTVAEALDLGHPITAAVASLDLALILARRGDWAELRAVAGAACVVLEEAGMTPDAWAALRILVDCDRSEAEAVIIEGLQRAGGASLRRTPGQT